MSVPARLYRYQSPTLHNITALANLQVWVSSPTAFNDPYDCAFDISISGSDVATIKRLSIEFGLCPADSFEEVFDVSMVKVLEERLKECIRGKTGAIKGICRFSEVKDNILMWGHYADGHKGFCLEFDTSALPLQFRPVCYSDDIPQMDFELLWKEGTDQVTRLLLTKARDWDYEKEWRVLFNNGNASHSYPLESLTGVYCGAKMPDEQCLMLMTLLERFPVKFHKMQISKTRFKVEARPMYLEL